MDETGNGLHLHMSLLLLGSLITAVAATLAVAVFGFLAYSAPLPDQPGGLPRGGPMPGGPTSLIISAAVFAAAWVSVVVAHARDQVLRKVAAARVEILTAIEECDGKRETEAYLRGMRSTVGGGDVRPLHLMPPPDMS